MFMSFGMVIEQDNSVSMNWAEYKANRDKNFEEENLSDYMKEVNRRIKFMQRTLFNKDNKLDEKKKDREIFFRQREIIMECLEELFIRQCMDDEVEAGRFHCLLRFA